MALETRCGELAARLQSLGEALDDLRLAVAEDRPRQGAPLLLDQLADAVLDLLGWHQEAAAAAAAARSGAGRPRDLDGAQTGLLACQDALQRIAERFTADLFNTRRLSQIGDLGRERGREWRRWAESAGGALDECQRGLLACGQAAAACWSELAELAGHGAPPPASTDRAAPVAGRAAPVRASR
jgi:hypothetical protein